MNESKIKKISFTGDILCDFPEYKYIKENKLNFDILFKEIRLKEKDEILVGNLETPICDELPYTFEPFSFNSPYSFLKEVKKSGFDILSVSNNHCLDRGHFGAIKTIKNIKSLEIEPIGIYFPKDKNYNIIEINGKKIAFISYTYGTNYSHNHCFLNRNKLNINILKTPLLEDNRKYNFLEYYLYNIKSYFKYTKIYLTLKGLKNYLFSKNTSNLNLGKSYIIDDLNNKEWKIDISEINKLKKTVSEAKKESDNIIFLLHSGGQFNKEVGTFTKEIVDILTKLPIDIVIGNHPHVVQKFEIVNDKPVFYSLGNFLFSPNSEYVNFKYKPQYSIKVNTYWDNAEIAKINIEILKVVELDKNHAQIVNTFEYIDNCDMNERIKLKEDCNFILNTVFNTENKKYINKLEKEYNVWEKKCQD